MPTRWWRSDERSGRLAVVSEPYGERSRQMASVVAYLTKDPDPAAPFRFRLGDRVISTLDTAMSGVIVWGRSRYTPGGGLYESIYEVELPDDPLSRQGHGDRVA